MMTREKALAALDEAGADEIKRMFVFFRVNEAGKPHFAARPEALEQIAIGIGQLVADLEAVSAIIDSKFPG